MNEGQKSASVLKPDKKLWFCAILWLSAAFFASGASAQRPPELEDVPEALPDPPRSGLDQRHTQLASTRDFLRARINKHDARCRVYNPNDPTTKDCPGAKIPLQADKETYIAAVKSFNWDLQQAVGEERNRLEKRISEGDQAISHDVTAVQRFGFNHRSEDFEKWASLSEETKHKVIDKLMEQIFETGSEEIREGIWEQLTSADNSGIDQVLLKLRTLGLGAAASADALHQYQRTGDKQVLRPIAKQLSEDLQSIIKFDENYMKGETSEAAFEALKFFVPPGIRQVLSLGEVAAWATYGVGMQVVAVSEVGRLNKLTDKELVALQKIHCLTERHVLERHEAKNKLAALMDRNVSEVVKPIQSKSCSG